MINRPVSTKHLKSPTESQSSCFLNSNSGYLGQQGFSLVELLLSVVLGSVLMYGVGALISMATNQNEAITNRIQSESELNEISFYLKHFASQGINVEDGSGKNLNNWSPSGTSQNTGFVRADYLASTGFNPATATASIDTIGIFLRDTLISTYTSVPSVGDRFLPTGIYFQKPTAKTFGILYIDLGRSQAAGTVSISPTRDDLWFGSIVDFQATEKEVERFDQNNPDQDPSTSSRYRLSSVTFKVTVREYLPQTNSKRDFTWCPPAAMTQAACKTTSPYKDVERVIRVVFRDNVLGFSSAQMNVTAETPNTLRAQRRPLYRRPYDLIYFLKPSYPSGQLKRN
ncbi:prepilin-type N-terminal cleavage/methylation domain-containing protein [Bdellovibrio sp. KM01]|uniref:prepilin-type N-terminal cleavage/methylation domain-containing protein n=1 Tax=Bdellovibrio sp. KM01 TaxID=2748865 RepID=UPI0015E99C8A|nr:prepilin-type N-terminal cleavage/methylation domain-containing protein [Bdellovibrio sp. KM01]QLY25565.1 prepilin-type N-terminal cleavage/methylation domain-containing protein [Bdellovibrio sp. KM01]